MYTIQLPQMQLHLLILNSVLARSSFQPCSNSVYKGVSQISYCQKQSALNNLEVTKQFVIQASQVSNIFIGVRLMNRIYDVRSITTAKMENRIGAPPQRTTPPRPITLITLQRPTRTI
ncbi:Hypothetical_protein [Hexamita inflata]|uniref:Hypothetical_protein n=1 Tax=Hexamita inflata TaxID=28002 RepID=A0AA86TUA7_9EUKA|nr:Hypothetical protein HINF_LOCUS16455 [Hexamita inflata]